MLLHHTALVHRRDAHIELHHWYIIASWPSILNTTQCLFTLRTGTLGTRHQCSDESPQGLVVGGLVVVGGGLSLWVGAGL